MSKPLKIGIAGLGTVGARTVRLIQEHAQALALSAGNWVTIPVQLINKMNSPHVQSALAVLALPPLIILGILIQPHLSRGFSFGALKN